MTFNLTKLATLFTIAKPKTDLLALKKTGSRYRIISLLLLSLLALFLIPQSPAYAASITVTTTADTIDAAGNCPAVTLASLPGPGGQISLREAVCAANSNPGPDTITFSVNGTFALTGAANEDNGGTGDLDIKQSLAINGNGISNTILDGSGTERIFDVFPSADSTFDISNMTLQNGDTRSTSFREGGAMYLHNNVTSTFNSIQVINNFSGANGAIENRGSLTINNSTISNNQTLPTSGTVTGGGIRNAGVLSINNSTISNNTVRGEGGGIATTTAAGVTVNITNSTISGNTASVTGGGLGNGGGISTTGNQGTINITNSTISGNRADNNGGGAAFASVSANSVNLNNVTITNNTADNDNNGSGAGGGFSQATTSVILQNTIVAGNFNSTAATRDDVSGAVVGSSSYNLIGDGTGMIGISNGTNNNQVGSGASPIDPLLGSLANNTGPTLTHALLSGSPAINTGNNATCAATDQRGIARPVGGVCDKGSFELADLTPPDTTITSTPPNPSNSSTATFTFTGSDSGGSGLAGFQCRIDGGSFTSCTSPQTYLGLVDGSHTFQVRALDGAGNLDPTPASYTWTINTAVADLTLNKSHSGNFTQGQSGAQYTIVVTNSGLAATSGTVTVVDTLPAGLTATALSGSGWSCTLATLTCTRNDALAVNNSYPTLTLTINVAGNAPASVTNSVTVSGGGEQNTGNNSDSDPTTIVADPVQTGATLVVNVTNDNNGTCTQADCSLREAINQANSNVDATTINFNIAGTGPHVIQPASHLPTISTPVIINGLSEPDISPANTCPIGSPTNDDLVIQIDDPGNLFYALLVNSSGGGSNIRGLSITRFGDAGAIQLQASGSVTCNYIGVAANGTTAAGNDIGIVTASVSNITIGGPSGDGNVIANNTQQGIYVSGGTTNSIVRGNVIRNNGLDGIVTEGTTLTGVRFTENVIYANGQEGIDLNNDGVTANDAGDGDGGPNNRQNFPVLSAAYPTFVQGSLNSNADGIYTIEFFSNATCEASGNGEGETYLGSLTNVATNGSGNSGTFTFTPGSALTVGRHITAMAIRTGGTGGGGTVNDTSEFSACFQVDAPDTTPPDTTITATPPNPTNSANATFSFSGTDNVTPPGSLTFECDLDGGGFSACTSPQSYTGLADSSHTFQVRAIDGVGNVDPTPASYTWVIDTVAPDTTITANPTNPSASANTSFSFTGSDPGGSGVASFQCQLDGGGFSACTSPRTYTGLADGSHTFQVRAIDGGGNIDPTPASYTWVIDTVAPDTTITANPTNPSASANASFSFTGSDPGGSGVASFQCQLDGGGFSACTSPRTYTGLTDSSHTFRVRAIDGAGNVDSTPASYTWTIDTTPPVAPVVVTPANGAVTSNPLPPISGTAEVNSTVTIFIDGTALDTTTADGAGTWSFTLVTPLSEGTHTVRARATDAIGNTSLDSNTNTFRVDTSAPDTTITIGPANPSNSTSASFSFTGSDGSGGGVVSFACSLDSGAFTTCTSPQSYTGLSDGSHTFQVRAVDAAGNSDPTPASYTWTIDTVAPDTTITAQPANPTNSTSAGFSFTGSDNISGGVSFACSLDSGAFVACTSPQTYTGLSDGNHTFQVRAIDAAGNSDSTPASYTWTIDTTPPTVAINQAAGQADPTGVTPISFTVVFNKPVTGFGDSTSDIGLSGTAPGTLLASVTGGPISYTISVSGMSGPGTVVATVAAGAAQDSSGNTNQASTSSDNTVTFNPATPLVTALGRTDPNPTNALSVNWDVTFSEDVMGVEATDFILTASGISSATITGVSGSGTNWQVTATTGSGEGSLGLNLVDDDTIHSFISGITLGGPGVGNGDFIGQVYTIDRTGPAAIAVTPVVVTGSAVYTFTVTYSDSLAVQVSSLNGDDIRVTGPNGFDQLAALVSVTPAGDGSPRQAVYSIPAPGGSWDGVDDGNYIITLEANQVTDTLDNSAAAGEVGTFVVGLTPAPSGLTLYLPLIFNNQTSGPDLVIDSLTAGSSGPQVVIRNAGNAPVTDDFWVDIYFNPNQTPRLNRPWKTIAPAGAVWGVTQDLAPGQSLSLTVGGAYYFPTESSTSFPSGAQVYALVDSINYNTSYGNVLESNETNNLTGPVVSTAGNGSLTAGEFTPSSPENLPER